jgi:hypothetical protein
MWKVKIGLMNGFSVQIPAKNHSDENRKAKDKSNINQKIRCQKNLMITMNRKIAHFFKKELQVTINTLFF